MKVGLIPSDTGACCFYRLAWPGEAVKNETGWDIHLFHPTRVHVAAMPDGGVAIHGIEDIESFDLFVLQRLPSVLQVEFIRAVQSVGVAVVVDVDDALWRIHPDNGSYERWTERVESGLRRFEILDAACAIADMVTVSTPPLAARYGAHGRVKILRNGLPSRAFASDVKTGFQGRIKIGWAGTLESHPNDLQIMGDSIVRVIEENDNVDLHVIGDTEQVADLLGVPADRVSGPGRVALDQYHEALRDIDIMLVPLADTAFNRAKSALKAQEAAAAGCLVLASATPEIERLYGLGGFVGGMVPHQGGPSNWHMVLSNMVRHIDDSAWVDFTPERARFLEYSRRPDGWIDAWQEAVAHRR